ncbi:MAG: glycosyltransferase [Gammaproteobacteria bacterium]|nr:glycosyltransferase [Gammaproteobacteria bacterium]
MSAKEGCVSRRAGATTAPQRQMAMRIDGRDYRINVLILCMPDEARVTAGLLKSLQRTLEPGVTISVLVNGGDSAELCRLSGATQDVKYYCSAQNLGVAGGRNMLLNAPECRESDIVMVLDNDVVVPGDYIRRLATFLVRRRDAGVVGGIAADLAAYNRLAADALDADSTTDVRSLDIKRTLLPDLRAESLFHAGVSRNYRYAYFSALPSCLHVLRRLPAFSLFRPLIPDAGEPPLLRGSSGFLKAVADGVESYEVSNVAGCSQAFRRDLVDRIGCLDERFNPYGFEDSEFCIRASKAGYRNYIDVNTWLLHGTDSRQGKRDRNRSLVNSFRGRTVLAALTLDDRGQAKRILLKLICLHFLLDLVQGPRTAMRNTMYRMRGYQDGLAILGDNRRRSSRQFDLSKAADR